MQTKSIIITICALILGIFIGYAISSDFSTGGTNNTDDDVIFCTMDAKMCPDGSYVGRVGPNCEFAACPGN